MEELKDRVADVIRLAESKKVLGDPHIRSMVWQLFGERGFNRLKSLANGTA